MNAQVSTTISPIASSSVRISRSPTARAWRRFQKHRLAVSGLVVLILLVLSALLAPWLSSHDPNLQNRELAKHGKPAPPSQEYPFGTDHFGRDYLSRSLYGARISLTVGFVAMGVAIGLGTLLGVISGYFGGWIDMVIMRVADLLLCFPPLLLLLAVQAALNNPNIFVVMVIIGLIGWMNVARLVRGEFLSLREREFIDAARTIGLTPLRIAFQEILPNAISPIIVAATLGIPRAILSESTLSFLGMGVMPPTPSWGNMLTGAVKYLQEGAWWIGFYPGLLISVTVLAFNFVGDGLRD
ncbi:MAG: ABC transporter permease, partial [Candidatus Tectomicrobia bacterium]|nr:ABC transporter permease [Candidatus Tectomicrobia bacterium]